MSIYEKEVHVDKRYYSHWCFNKERNHFKVPDASKWEMHSFNFKSQDRTFKVMASSNTCPQIILFENASILACQFHVSLHYPGSLIPLKNFIQHKLKELSFSSDLESRKYLNIFNVDSNWYDGGKQVEDFAAALKFKQFKHSGLSIAGNQRNY